MSGTVVAYIGVGSNIDPGTHVPMALDLLAGQVRVTGSSTFHRTVPLYRPDQPEYRNGVWRITTSAAPRELRDTVLRPIEAACGRLRGDDRRAARIIDLDILMYGDMIIREDGFVVPDPDIYTRAFVAAPLAELAPELILPDTGRAVAEVATSLPRDGMIPDNDLTRRLRERIGI
jgi:2-amino-4-hydroxy-6-hydroxymethyldihydropteridine diphosphokinase